MKKRGMVTLFIIIGLVLLIVIGLFYYLKESLILKDIFIPKEIIPLQKYAEKCIRDAASQAIFLASMQGGYIELPKKITKDPEAYILTGFKVPMWYYKTEDRTPSIQSFVFYIESYINEQSLQCINNFEPFKEQYDINDIKKITTKVKLNNQEMIIDSELDTTVKAKNKNTVIKFPKITTKQPTKIKKLFLLAKEIMLRENTDNFLEILTDDMIASSDYLPYAGIEMTCDDRTWTVNSMIPYVKNMLVHNFKFLTFEDTAYQPTGYDYYEKQYRVSLKGNDYKDLQVNTIYNPKWNLQLEVSPNKKGIVKPLEFTMSNFVFACVKLYNHKYSVEYPLLFQIIDKDNSNNVFYFATPVLIKRNEPDRYNEVPSWPSEDDAETNTEYCNDNEPITQMIVGENNQIFAKTAVKQNKKNALIIYAYDASQNIFTGLLNNVTISYQCVKFRCEIGKTNYPKDINDVYTGSDPYLKALFPDCENGIITAEKQGYLPAKLHQTVSAETNGYAVNIPMTKLKEFKLRVHVFEENKYGAEETVERELLPTESVLITLKNKQRLYDKVIYFPNDENKVELMLANEPYDVDIKLVENDEIVGKASYTWQPELEQVQFRNGVLFFVGKIPQSSSNLVEQYKKLQQTEDKNKDNVEPRLTLG